MSSSRRDRDRQESCAAAEIEYPLTLHVTQFGQDRIAESSERLGRGYLAPLLSARIPHGLGIKPGRLAGSYRVVCGELAQIVLLSARGEAQALPRSPCCYALS